MGASSIGNAPNQPVHHGPARPTNQADARTRPSNWRTAPSTSNQQSPTSHAHVRSKIPCPKLLHLFLPHFFFFSFFSLLPPPLPHFAIRSTTTICGGARAVAIPPRARRPVAPPPLRLEVCTSPLLHRRSRIPPSTTLPSTLQRAAVLRWPASSALRGDLLPQRVAAAVSSGVGDVGSSSISSLRG
jgi:hypothetical protein